MVIAWARRERNKWICVYIADYCFLERILIYWPISKCVLIVDRDWELYRKLLKLCKELCKEKFNMKLVFTSFKIKNYFHIKTQFLMIWNLSKYLNLLWLALFLAILVRLVVILKLGLTNLSKSIARLVFLIIYLSPQHALICIIFFL